MKKNMKVIYKGGQTDVSKTDHLNQILQFFSFCIKKIIRNIVFGFIFYWKGFSAPALKSYLMEIWVKK